MRAVILAGGLGTRLGPVCSVIPKPLVPVGGRPIAETILRQLAGQGFTRATFALGHGADMMRAFFGPPKLWGLTVDFVQEDEPLGTMGPLNLIHDLPDDFLVINGDVLSDMDYGNLMTIHREHINGPMLTVACFHRHFASEFGVMKTGPFGRVVEFKEKPKTPLKVSMGAYAMRRSCKVGMPMKGVFGFDNLMALLLKCGHPVIATRHRGYWKDIGRPEDLVTADSEFHALFGHLYGRKS